MAKKIKEYWAFVPKEGQEQIAKNLTLKYGIIPVKVCLADEVDKEMAKEIASGIALAIAELFKFNKAYAEAWKEINNIGADDPDDGDPESITCGNVVSLCLDILKKHMGEPKEGEEAPAPIPELLNSWLMLNKVIEEAERKGK